MDTFFFGKICVLAFSVNNKENGNNQNPNEKRLLPTMNILKSVKWNRNDLSFQ